MKHSEITQQQLAGIVFLTCWHFTHTSSESLQPSMQHGRQQRKHIVSGTAQRNATHPAFFLTIWPVLPPQNWHGLPSFLLFPPSILMMVGPCWTGGCIGGIYIGCICCWYIGCIGCIGCPYIGCPYIFEVITYIYLLWRIQLIKDLIIHFSIFDFGKNIKNERTFIKWKQF